MAQLNKQGYWVLKVMIEGEWYTERTELRGNSQEIKKKVKRLQDVFKRQKKQELAAYRSSQKRNETGDIVDEHVVPAFDAYYEAQGQYAKGHAPKDILRDLLWVADQLGHDTLVSEITTRKLVVLRELRRAMPKWGREGADPISGRTCNATFERLKFCLNWLKENGYTIPAISWKTVWVEEAPRQTAFTVETARLLFSTMREDYRDCLEFAVLGGPRRKQFVALTWSDIDWNRRVLTFIPQKKRGARRSPKSHIIPITNRMMELILKQIDPDTGQPFHPVYVWTFVAQRSYINRKAQNGLYEEGDRYPVTYQGLGTVWRRWKAEHGIENCRLHDLRHAAGTMLEEVANDLAMPQQMLGHNNRATTERYIHRSLDKLRAAMEASHNALQLRGGVNEAEAEGAARAEDNKNQGDAELEITKENQQSV
jgi:integrase